MEQEVTTSPYLTQARAARLGVARGTASSTCKCKDARSFSTRVVGAARGPLHPVAVAAEPPAPTPAPVALPRSQVSGRRPRTAALQQQQQQQDAPAVQRLERPRRRGWGGGGAPEAALHPVVRLPLHPW